MGRLIMSVNSKEDISNLGLSTGIYLLVNRSDSNPNVEKIFIK